MLKFTSFKLLYYIIENIIKIRIKKNPLLKPLTFAYCITEKCNFKCSYCDWANNNRTVIPKYPDLKTEGVFKILKIIRKACPFIYLTGGEPLLRNDLIDILKECKRLKFKAVSVVTNLSLMHKKIDILEYIDNLIVSLDMLDEKEYSKIIGVPPSIVSKIKTNLVKCAQYQHEKKFNLVVNFVANEKTIYHAKEVIDFCIKHNIIFTFGPEIMNDGKVKESIKKNQEYNNFIKYLIECKSGEKKSIFFNSVKYLKIISSFKYFKCYPILVPRVEPDGTFTYPCGILNKSDLNILETGSYNKVLKKAYKLYGPYPNCKDMCFIDCYIVPSYILTNPISSLFEFFEL